MKYIVFVMIISSPLSAEYICPPCDSAKVYVPPLNIIEGEVRGKGMRTNGSHYLLVQGLGREFVEDADNAIAAGLEHGDNVTLACTTNRRCWIWDVKKKTQ